ncbi:MAG TPA: hypothetical protein VF097_03995 [Actinomycetota bacterium]
MSEQSPFPRSIYGRAFGEGFVAALVDSRVEATRLVELLAVTGIRRGDVGVLPGELALVIDASHHPSLAVSPPAPGEVAVSEKYVAGALLGDVLLAVRTPAERRARVVAGILLSEGASLVFHFGPGFLRAPDLTEAAA